MDNPLSKLELDHWYKVIMVVGAVVFLLAGSGLLPEFPTAPTTLISSGCFFIGLGEWVNHPLQTILMPRSADYPSGVLTGNMRRNKPLGIIFVILGFALIVFGVEVLLT